MSTAPEPLQDEAKRLAQRVALLSGESEVQAVVISLRERLERLEERKRKRAEFESLRSSWRAHPAMNSSQADDEMYDDNGLPK